MAAGSAVAGAAPGADSPAATAAAPDTAPRADAVIVVSLDGLSPGLLGASPTPMLRRMARDGVRAEALRPVFPTHTFPNHHTVVTGLRPDGHGVIADRMFDPRAGGWFDPRDRESLADPRWWGGEPIWATLQAQGGRAGVLSWPGPATMDGDRPHRWIPYGTDLTRRARVDSALAWLAPASGPGMDLLLLYFDEPEATAHVRGPAVQETASAVGRMDWALEQLVEGIEERGLANRVDLLVISGHGMAAATANRAILLEDHLPAAVPLDSLRLVTRGAVAMMEARSGDPRLEERALESLRGAHPRMGVFRKGELAGQWSFGTHERVPEIVALADPGWVVWTRRALEERDLRVPWGMRGYAPETPDMQGIFLVRGPSFRRGATVEAFSIVHLYELLAYLLGVEPVDNHGSLDSVRSVLRWPGTGTEAGR